MKATQTRELFANIKNTFVSFLSILIFVALGVGVFLGITWAAPALEIAADTMFNEGSFHNFQVQYIYGLTDSDLKKLSKVEGVSQVEPAYQSFQTVELDDALRTVEVQSLGKEIDTPLLVEGALPTKAGEMAFQAESAERLGVSIGDTIVFKQDADDETEQTFAVFSGESIEDAENAKSPSGMMHLTRDKFTVTAIINSSDYIAKEWSTYGYSTLPSGTVDALAWVTDDSFRPESFFNGYPIVNVRSDSLEGLSTYSDDYGVISDEIFGRISEAGDILATARYDDLNGQAQKNIDEAQAEIDDGKRRIAEGEKELEEGRAALETERAEGEAKLESAYQELLGYEWQKSQAEAEIADAKSKVADGEAKLAEADAARDEFAGISQEAHAYKTDLDAKLAKGEITQEEYDASLDEYGKGLNAKLQPYAVRYNIQIPAIDHTNFDLALVAVDMALDSFEDITITYEGQQMTIREARAKIAAAKQTIATYENELAVKTYELNEGWSKYYAGQEELETTVAEAEQKIATGEEELAAARKQVAENEPKLKKAEEQFAAMQEFNWTILPRSHNLGSIEVSTFSAVTDSLSISMAALFIIVGLLVSYFAVSRIVHEQVTQIGTKKALGMRRGEITASYLWYSGIAVAVGAIIGAIVGYFLVEGIVGGVLGTMFSFGAYPAYFGITLFVLILAIEMGLILGATYLACRGILKKHAIELLRGEQLASGKAHFYEKWGIWAKIPLFIQIIVNNCVNDKRRLLSTIVGVAGCTALIVTAITLNNDVLASRDRHYENVYGFNAIAYAELEPEHAAEDLEEAIEQQGVPAARASLRRYLMLLPTGESDSVRMIVPADVNEFMELYHINPISEGEVDLSEDGAWVSRAYADHFGAKVGDVVVVDIGDGITHEIPILGFYEFWLTYHEMVVSPEYCEKEFGEPAETNAVLIDTGETAVEDLGATLTSVKGFNSIVDDKKEQCSNFDAFSTVSSAVVAIYLALAALMAVVVLLNLNVMFIQEKKRELIVLMINGFSVKDARHYVSYDTIVLSVLGIVAGLILGCLMGAITVGAVEPTTATFVKDIDGWAVIIGIGGSALLALIMGLISLRRVGKFVLTDINRF